MDCSKLQKVLIGKAERLYREFKDANDVLTNATSPYVYIYNPNAIMVDSGTPTNESTGVYYKTVTFNTANVTEGIYQAYWEGTIGGALITMDDPQYFYVSKYPWRLMTQDAVAQSIRRFIGDTDPKNYRVGVSDMYYFIQDAVDEVQAELDFGYELTITPTTMTWNQELYTTPLALFKLKTLILVMESILHDRLYDGANVQVGDIKVDVTGILKIRMENIKRLKEDFRNLMYQVKLNSIEGSNIDTYVTGIIRNDVNVEVWSYGF